MKTILLTGPCGSVGYKTLLELLKFRKEYKIIVFELKTRKNVRKLNRHKEDIDICWGNIINKTEIENALKNCDIIIHTAALIPPKADKYTELARKINVEGTMNIVDSVNQNNPNTFLIYTSSISVYGDRIENPEISVFDPVSPSPGDYYALTKLEAERYIKENVKNFTIFRLSAVMDENVKIDPLFFHMPLNTSLEIVTSDDVGRALVKACEKMYFLNERTFNLGGGETCRITYKDFLNKSFHIFGLKKIEFPKFAFAEQNFHCGYYKDSKRLDRLLNFQKNDLNDYFKKMALKVHPAKKILTIIFRSSILRNLLKKSEPYRAFINKNIEQINHFFKSKNLAVNNEHY